MSTRLPVVDVGDLGFDGGAHVLVKLALADLAAGDALGVRGTHPDLAGGLAAWCRQHGHRCRTAEHRPVTSGVVAIVERGRAAGARWVGAERGGLADPRDPGAVVERPAADWGLAARGAMVEPGGPTPEFRLDRRDEVWTGRAADVYRQALAAQWDPAALDWSAPITHGPQVEAAVVQVMSFLVENEEAALVVPARFLGQVHPHFREIQQVLAITVADEARHVDVFARRAARAGHQPALSTVGGRASLQTILDEPDYATAAFLLSVMGEGTFLSLLSFLERHAPDPLTRQIAHHVRADEARHVAFAMAHLERHLDHEPGLRARLALAVERRHRALQHTAGLNDEVFDALVLLAAGSARPEAVATGWTHVQTLQREMTEGREARLARLGFSAGEGATLAALHTRNFM